jgi:hypothetical protein
MIGEMTSLKQMSQRDDVKSSGPQEIEDSLCHSFPHFMHFTRNLFITYTTLGFGSFCSLKHPWSFFKPRAGCKTELSKKYQTFSKSIKTVTIAFQAAGEKGNPQEERAGQRQCHEHFILPLLHVHYVCHVAAWITFSRHVAIRLQDTALSTH